MFRRLFLATAACCAIAGAPAYAQASLTSVPGADPYVGQAPTYDFETGAPVSGGLVTTGSLDGIRAQPFGSTGNYWTIGPADGSPGVMDLKSFVDTYGGIASISFLWGSVDAYNTLELLDYMGNVLMSWTGADAAVNPNGNQTSPITNPIATIWIDSAFQGNIGGVRLSSSQNAFEVDNFVITPVPEPGVWAMLLFGFGLIGFSMRRRKSAEQRQRVRVAYS